MSCKIKFCIVTLYPETTLTTLRHLVPPITLLGILVSRKSQPVLSEDSFVYFRGSLETCLPTQQGCVFPVNPSP